MRYVEVPYGNLYWIVPLLMFLFGYFMINKISPKKNKFFGSNKDFCLVLLFVFCFFSLFIIFDFQYMNEIDKDIIQRAEINTQKRYSVVNLEIKTPKNYEVLINTNEINLSNEYNDNYSPALAFLSGESKENLEKGDYFFNDRFIVEDKKKVKLYFEKDIRGQKFKLDFKDFEIVLPKIKEQTVKKEEFNKRDLQTPKRIYLEEIKEKGKIEFQKDFFKIVSHEEIKSLVFGNKNLISKLYSQTFNLC